MYLSFIFGMMNKTRMGIFTGTAIFTSGMVAGAVLTIVGAATGGTAIAAAGAAMLIATPNTAVLGFASPTP